MAEKMKVGETEYQVLKLLGHGKGGYSYLVEHGGAQYVLKQIHHEPCDYYSFGDKLEAERNDYARLLRAGIRIPKLLEIDSQRERILKEYIEGPTVCELVLRDDLEDGHLRQVRQMAELAYAAGLNIDYFPTNFIVQRGLLYYIDYECNEYMEKWSFETWGIKYWSKTPEFLEYMRAQA